MHQSTLRLVSTVLLTSLAIAQAAPAQKAGHQVIASTRAATPQGPAMQPQRFEVTYAAVFGDGTPAGNITLYLPVPSESEAQTLEAISVEPQLGDGKLLKWQLKREAEYGNRFLEAQVQDVKPGARFSLNYTVTRRELANSLEMPKRAETVPPSARFLQPDRLVPLDGPVRSLAKETLSGHKNDFDAMLKAIYEKTVALMRYDKTGTGWGQGDVIWACDNKRGNCTDFHSVLIGMARASRIPGKFEIGLQMPLEKEEGKLSGYHCWAYLFHPQRGWVPMDASEGWKNDKKFKDYYLGRIGSDRIALSVGRDLKLGQRGAPLNYFVFPYAEAGNTAVPMSVDVSFRKIAIPPNVF